MALCIFPLALSTFPARQLPCRALPLPHRDLLRQSYDAISSSATSHRPLKVSWKGRAAADQFAIGGFLNPSRGFQIDFRLRQSARRASVSFSSCRVRSRSAAASFMPSCVARVPAMEIEPRVAEAVRAALSDSNRQRSGGSQSDHPAASRPRRRSRSSFFGPAC